MRLLEGAGIRQVVKNDAKNADEAYRKLTPIHYKDILV